MLLHSITLYAATGKIVAAGSAAHALFGPVLKVAVCLRFDRCLPFDSQIFQFGRLLIATHIKFNRNSFTNFEVGTWRDGHTA
jgi:hypothetical protein